LGQSLAIDDGVDMIDSVARALGLPASLRVPEGVDRSAPMSGNPQEKFDQFAATVQQALSAISQTIQGQQQQQQAVSQEVAKLKGLIMQAQPTPKGSVASD